MGSHLRTLGNATVRLGAIILFVLDHDASSASWLELTNGVPSVAGVTSLAANDSGFVSAVAVLPSGSATLLVSRDGGYLWKPSVGSVEGINPTTKALAVVGETLIVSTLGGRRGVWVSEDFGASFAQARGFPSDYYDAVESFATDGDKVFAEARGAGDIWVSDDRGKTWSLVTPYFRGPAHTPSSWAFGVRGSRQVVGTFSGIFLSDDHGRSWTRLSDRVGAGYVPQVQLTSFGSYLVQSTTLLTIDIPDTSLRTVTNDLPRSTIPKALLTTADTLLLAGSLNSRPFVSASLDSGSHWETLSNSTLRFGEVAVAAVCGRYLVIGTRGGSGLPGGMWRLALSAEIVPAKVVGRLEGTNRFALNVSAGYGLQASQELTGPWVDVPTPNQTYSGEMKGSMFFRPVASD